MRHRMEETSSWTRNVKCETHGILCPRDPSGQFFFSSEGSCLISNEKSLILRPKVWIFYKTPNIENLNCDIYLTIWTFKKNRDTTGTFPTEFLGHFLMQATHHHRFSGSLLQSDVVWVQMSVLSSVDSRFLWRCHLHCSVQDQHGLWDSGQGQTPLIQILTFMLFFPG